MYSHPDFEKCFSKADFSLPKKDEQLKLIIRKPIRKTGVKKKNWIFKIKLRNDYLEITT